MFFVGFFFVGVSVYSQLVLQKVASFLKVVTCFVFRM